MELNVNQDQLVVTTFLDVVDMAHQPSLFQLVQQLPGSNMQVVLSS